MKRRCVEIKFKDDDSKRLVTFTKRRNGLFSKAKKLSDLTGAHIAVLVLSRSGKPYSFGTPNVDAVIHRFLGSPAAAAEKEWWDVPVEGMGLEELRRHKEFLEDLRSNLATKQSQNTLLLQQEPHDHDQMVKIEETQQHESGEESSFWFPTDQPLVSLDDIFHDDMSPVTSNDFLMPAAAPCSFDFQY